MTTEAATTISDYEQEMATVLRERAEQIAASLTRMAGAASRAATRDIDRVAATPGLRYSNVASLIQSEVAWGVANLKLDLLTVVASRADAARAEALEAGIKFSRDQVEALRALLGLVHYDDLAQGWRDMLPAELLAAINEED